MRALALLVLTIAAAGLGSPAMAATQPAEILVRARPAGPYRASPVADANLAAMRGGINLPNGLAVSIGLDIQTRVDGLLVLHTIYASDGPIAGVRVFTDGTAPVRTAPDTVTVMTPGDSGAVGIEVSSGVAGVTITPSARVAPSTVNLVSGPASIWLGAEGQTEVPVVANGGPVAATSGAISLRTDELGSVVTLDAVALQVQHLIGQATGIVVANTANDRVIDTVSSVNVDLQGSAIPLLASLLSADNLALDILRGR